MRWLRFFYRKCRDLWWLLFQKRKDKEWFAEHVETENTREPAVYYIIRRESKVGLFSYVQTTLGQIVYALSNGMIPIVDMKNYSNTYLEDEEIGITNAWELFFKQVCGKNLEDIYRDEQYVLSEDSNIDLRYTPRLNGVYQKRAYWFWSEMYDKYVRLSDLAAKYCNEEYDKLLKNKAEYTLGVLVRGTDYKYAVGHAMQPRLEDVIKKVKNILKKDKRFRYIYLATDEKRTVEMFEEEFAGKVITNQRTYFDGYDFSCQTLADIVIERENDRYLRGLEYLSSIHLLSKCAGLCAGLCGGTFAAFYMNHGKYSYRYFWDLEYK